MTFDIEGRIFEVFPTEQVTPSFRKREFILEHTEQFNDREFTDYIRFQLTQDRCDILDRFGKGMDVKVSFSLKGRRYEKGGEVRYFTNLEAWRMEKQGATAPPPADLPGGGELPPASEEDDLPF